MISILGVHGLPDVQAGDPLAELVSSALLQQGDSLLHGDIVVITSKVVSKSEDRFVPFCDRASLVLQESTAVVTERRTTTGMTRVVASAAGPVMAGAGIDASNADDDRLLLLPVDADRSARGLHADLARLVGHSEFGVILSDTSGRPWRVGLTDFALGSAGVRLVDDLRGHADTSGRDLAVTIRNLADTIAAAADLVKGKLDRIPVAIVRGLGELVIPVDPGEGARDLVRSGPADWFRLGQAEAVRSALGVDPGTPEALAVGVASVHPETLEDQVARVVNVARHGEPDDGVALTVVGDSRHATIELSGDPVALGRLWARLEVALRGEDLTFSSACRDNTVTLHLPK